MNQSAYSVDHAYTNMSTLVDKEKIVGANKKHLHQAGHAKLIQAPAQVDESMNRSKFKKQMFASKEESMPKKGKTDTGKAPTMDVLAVSVQRKVSTPCAPTGAGCAPAGAGWGGGGIPV